MVKFIYSEKATKFCEISTVDLTVTTQDKFVAFSEYMNFTGNVNKCQWEVDLWSDKICRWPIMGKVWECNLPNILENNWEIMFIYNFRMLFGKTEPSVFCGCMDGRRLWADSSGDHYIGDSAIT